MELLYATINIESEGETSGNRTIKHMLSKDHFEQKVQSKRVKAVGPSGKELSDFEEL